MPRSGLTAFEQVLLGMIFSRPATGYDLKRRFATSALGVHQPSSGALYPALDRLERRGLLASAAPPSAEDGRPRRLYQLTEAGRQAHRDWLRQPVEPQTVGQDLGLHLVRFVMMAPTLPPEAAVGFLESLRTALAGFVASLERQLDAADVAAHPYAGLGVEHGLAVHRASLTWAEQAIKQLAGAPGTGLGAGAA